MSSHDPSNENTLFSEHFKTSCSHDPILSQCQPLTTLSLCPDHPSSLRMSSDNPSNAGIFFSALSSAGAGLSYLTSPNAISYLSSVASSVAKGTETALDAARYIWDTSAAAERSESDLAESTARAGADPSLGLSTVEPGAGTDQPSFRSSCSALQSKAKSKLSKLSVTNLKSSGQKWKGKLRSGSRSHRRPTATMEPATESDNSSPHVPGHYASSDSSGSSCPSMSDARNIPSFQAPSSAYPSQYVPGGWTDDGSDQSDYRTPVAIPTFAIPTSADISASPIRPPSDPRDDAARTSYLQDVDGRKSRASVVPELTSRKPWSRIKPRLSALEWKMSDSTLKPSVIPRRRRGDPPTVTMESTAVQPSTSCASSISPSLSQSAATSSAPNISPFQPLPSATSVNDSSQYVAALGYHSGSDYPDDHPSAIPEVSAFDGSSRSLAPLSPLTSHPLSVSDGAYDEAGTSRPGASVRPTLRTLLRGKRLLQTTAESSE